MRPGSVLGRRHRCSRRRGLRHHDDRLGFHGRRRDHGGGRRGRVLGSGPAARTVDPVPGAIRRVLGLLDGLAMVHLDLIASNVRRRCGRTDRRPAGAPIQRPCRTMARRRPASAIERSPDACSDPMPGRRPGPRRAGTAGGRARARGRTERGDAGRARSDHRQRVPAAEPHGRPRRRRPVGEPRQPDPHHDVEHGRCGTETLSPGDTFRRRFRRAGTFRLPLRDPQRR